MGSANIDVSNGSKGGTVNKDSLRTTAQTSSTPGSSNNHYDSWEDLDGVLETTIIMSMSNINFDAQGK